MTAALPIELEERCLRLHEKGALEELDQALLDVAQYYFEFRSTRSTWYQLIKDIRRLSGKSIAEAKNLALRHSEWHDWSAHRAIRHRECAKEYLSYRKGCAEHGVVPRLNLGNAADSELREKFSLRGASYRFPAS